MEYFIGIGSFLGGALVTAFGYTLFLTNKLATLNTKFEDHQKAGAPSCPLHGDLATKVGVAANESQDIKRRLEKLEKNS